MDEAAFARFRGAVGDCLGDRALAETAAFGELAVRVPAAGIAESLRSLRDDSGLALTSLVDLTAVDWPDRSPRFDIVYHLLSMGNATRLRVKIQLSAAEQAHSVTDVFPVADWYEREVFDMYGIEFAGHPDLRRILTDYGFQGHPLRKDFPLTGFVELRYDESRKRVAYEPVHLAQAWRNFDFLSPWEGADAVRKAAETGDS